MNGFSENLKKLMQDRGVTAKLVCEATGIPQSTFSEWTSGREPKLTESVVRLARFFGCSIEALITGQEPEHDLVAEVIQSMDTGFATVHKGVYRISIEKFVGVDRRKRKMGDRGGDE
jgi:transcriptional regulator with XRE-family HTH domain